MRISCYLKIIACSAFVLEVYGASIPLRSYKEGIWIQQAKTPPQYLVWKESPESVVISKNISSSSTWINNEKFLSRTFQAFLKHIVREKKQLHALKRVMESSPQYRSKILNGISKKDSSFLSWILSLMHRNPIENSKQEARFSDDRRKKNLFRILNFILSEFNIEDKKLKISPPYSNQLYSCDTKQIPFKYPPFNFLRGLEPVTCSDFYKKFSYLGKSLKKTSLNIHASQPHIPYHALSGIPENLIISGVHFKDSQNLEAEKNAIFSNLTSLTFKNCSLELKNLALLSVISPKLRNIFFENCLIDNTQPSSALKKNLLFVFENSLVSLLFKDVQETNVKELSNYFSETHVLFKIFNKCRKNFFSNQKALKFYHSIISAASLEALLPPKSNGSPPSKSKEDSNEHSSDEEELRLYPYNTQRTQNGLNFLKIHKEKAKFLFFPYYSIKTSCLWPKIMEQTSTCEEINNPSEDKNKK